MVDREGPIQIDAHDVNLVVDGGLAFVSALTRMRGRQGGEARDFRYRTTMCLRKTRGDGESSAITRLCPSTWMAAIGPTVDLEP
jgi:ketosteroid isomerase-like protein